MGSEGAQTTERSSGSEDWITTTSDSVRGPSLPGLNWSYTSTTSGTRKKAHSPQSSGSEDWITKQTAFPAPGVTLLQQLVEAQATSPVEMIGVGCSNSIRLQHGSFLRKHCIIGN